MCNHKLTIENLQDAIMNFFNQISKEMEHMLDINVDLNGKAVKLLLDKNLEINDPNQINANNGLYYFKKVWHSYIPNADSKGVYIFFNSANEAEYVGMSLDTIGRRVCSHIRPTLEFEKAEYVVTIPFGECPSLAPALDTI